MATKQKEKGKRPDFTIRARQSPESDFFITVGAAWEIVVGDKTAYSIKLTSMPINWDGSALMLVPKEEE
jgi:hypothetical protein